MALDGGEHQPPGCFLSAACGSPIFNKTHEIDIEFHEVSYDDMLFCLPFLTPETKFAEQNGLKG